ncbi:MAG TPA: hypothetical protein VKU00_18955 [Chthonomonadaceae bacterium]|nr:hypothetical protein [Chthonomonadaceae bacterium]
MKSDLHKPLRALGIAVCTLGASLGLWTSANAQGRLGGGFSPAPIAPRPAPPPPVQPSINRAPAPVPAPRMEGLPDRGRGSAPVLNPPRPITGNPTPYIPPRREPFIPGRNTPSLPDNRNGLSTYDRYKNSLEAERRRHHDHNGAPPIFYPYAGLGAFYDPFNYGYFSPFGSYGYSPDYYPYGAYPPYLTPEAPYTYPPPNVYNDDSLMQVDRKNEEQVRRAAKEIQQAWLDGNLDGIAKYTRRDQQIEVKRNGHKASPRDVSAFLNSLQNDLSANTVAFTFDTPERIQLGVYQLTGHRTFVDDHGNERSSTVRFTLTKIDGQFYITAFETE